MQAINTALRRVPTAALYIAGAIPLVWLVVQVANDALGADPVRTLEKQLGLTALQFLIAGLAVTPLRKLAGLNLLKFRRALGLLAFAYASLHLATWLLLDLQLRWAEIGADLIKRPYVMVGMAGFAMLIPLAATSNAKSIRKLGAAGWSRLHKLTYPAILAGAAHFVMLEKTWSTEALAYFGAVTLLLVLRVAPIRRTAARQAA